MSEKEYLINAGMKTMSERVEEKELKLRCTNGIYSDESCLEKISSKEYRVACLCESVRERNRKELQKSLIKRMK